MVAPWAYQVRVSQGSLTVSQGSLTVSQGSLKLSFNDTRDDAARVSSVNPAPTWSTRLSTRTLPYLSEWIESFSRDKLDLAVPVRVD